MSLFDTLVKYGMPFVPKPIVGRVARRYVAGDTLDDAAHTLRALNEEGAMGTVDILGEEVREPVKATAAVAEYLRLLERIEDEKLDANISIKPTMLGLKIDQTLCEENLLGIVERAAEFDNFVRVDMEDHTCTDNTIRLFRQMHEKYPSTVGVVLQSYLHRTIADINDLLPLAPNIRICKGIYREPREIAWKDFETIRANFVFATEKLLSRPLRIPDAARSRPRAPTDHPGQRTPAAGLCALWPGLVSLFDTSAAGESHHRPSRCQGNVPVVGFAVVETVFERRYARSRASACRRPE